MLRLLWTLCLVCTQRLQPGGTRQAARNDAAAALGGADRIAAIKTLIMEGGGTDQAVGGSQTPVSPQNIST